MAPAFAMLVIVVVVDADVVVVTAMVVDADVAIVMVLVEDGDVVAVMAVVVVDDVVVEHIDPGDPSNILLFSAFELTQAYPQSVRLKDIAS